MNMLSKHNLSSIFDKITNNGVGLGRMGTGEYFPTKIIEPNKTGEIIIIFCRHNG